MLMWSEGEDGKKGVVFVFIYEEKMDLSVRAIELCVLGSK